MDSHLEKLAGVVNARLSDTLAVHSVEGYLQPEEIAVLHLEAAKLLRHVPDARLSNASVHSLPGSSPREAAALYSPSGRLESVDPTPSMTRLLDWATDRNMEKVRGIYGSVERHSDWIIVAYRKGQFIVPHADLPDIGPDSREKVAGVSVVISKPRSGGRFFIETTGSNHEWKAGGPEWKDTPGEFDPSFAQTKRTRWVCDPCEGDALLYGSRLIHGTLPVEDGMAIKALSFFY